MAQRCLRCGLVNPASANRCDCGAPLGSEAPAIDIGELHGRLRHGQQLVAGGIALAVGMTGVTAYLILSGGPIVVCTGAIGFGVLLVVRGATVIGRVRESLRELEGKTDRIPTARVRRR